jgi:hypothetical protein
MRHAFALSGLAATGLLLLAAAGPVQAQSRTQVGTLACHISPGVSFVVGSSKTLDCVFSAPEGIRELYAGTVNRIGLDIGFTSGGQLVWAVFAPTNVMRPGALAGNYVGASAEATAGAGLGANALVGGSNRTVSLQPLSVQGQTGIGLAAGVAAITLDAVVPPQRRRR